MADKILVIDDEEKIRKLLSIHLESEGYRVDTCANGREAMERLSVDPSYNCILTDLEMPEMNGMELLEECKTLFPTLPVLIVTGRATVDQAIESLKLGAAGLIEKPFDPEKIKKTVREVLSLRSKSDRKKVSLPYLERKWTFEIPSDLTIISAIVDILIHGMREMDLIAPGKEVETRELFLAALGNAVSHGNKNNPNKNIFINASATNKHILTSIQDEGEGFFPDDHIDETDLNAKIWNHSKGLHKIYKLAKKVVFNAKGNQIIFILERKPAR